MEADPHRDRDEARLADQVSHELGTALALIAGYADSLREVLGSPEPGTDVAASLDGIERGVERLRAVSDRLAVWARAQGGPDSEGADGQHAG